MAPTSKHRQGSCRYSSLLQQARPPYICAHGGDTTAHPPNTAAAYASALNAGADCIEVDAALTADLQLVALHDRDLQRLIGQPTVKVGEVLGSELTSCSWCDACPACFCGHEAVNQLIAVTNTAQHRVSCIHPPPTQNRRSSWHCQQFAKLKLSWKTQDEAYGLCLFREIIWCVRM